MVFCNTQNFMCILILSSILSALEQLTSLQICQCFCIENLFHSFINLTNFFLNIALSICYFSLVIILLSSIGFRWYTNQINWKHTKNGFVFQLNRKHSEYNDCRHKRNHPWLNLYHCDTIISFKREVITFEMCYVFELAVGISFEHIFFNVHEPKGRGNLRS